jgi:hypothetical protein
MRNKMEGWTRQIMDNSIEFSVWLLTLLSSGFQVQLGLYNICFALIKYGLVNIWLISHLIKKRSSKTFPYNITIYE